MTKRPSHRKKVLSGKSRRRKGHDFERQTALMLKNHGLDARRVALSGASFEKGDVIIEFENEKLTVECKRTRDKFKTLYKIKDGNDIVVIKDDLQDILFIMNPETFFKFLKKK